MMFRRAMVRRIASEFADNFYNEINKLVSSKMNKMGFVMVVLKHKGEDAALDLLEYITKKDADKETLLTYSKKPEMVKITTLIDTKLEYLEFVRYAGELIFEPDLLGGVTEIANME
jgi:aminopeptidase-like protein